MDYLQKLKDLDMTGSVRFYKSEGYELTEFMTLFDKWGDTYIYGLCDYGNGEFLEVQKLDEE